jgi:hypothetical protein
MVEPLFPFDAHFGHIAPRGKDDPLPPLPDETDDDDDSVPATPDVIAILGLDPDKLDFSGD